MINYTEYDKSNHMDIIIQIREEADSVAAYKLLTSRSICYNIEVNDHPVCTKVIHGQHYDLQAIVHFQIGIIAKNQ